MEGCRYFREFDWADRLLLMLVPMIYGVLGEAYGLGWTGS